MPTVFAVGAPFPTEARGRNWGADLPLCTLRCGVMCSPGLCIVGVEFGASVLAPDHQTRILTSTSVTVVFRSEGRLWWESAALPGECCYTPRGSAADSRQRRPLGLKTTVTLFGNSQSENSRLVVWCASRAEQSHCTLPVRTRSTHCLMMKEMKATLKIDHMKKTKNVNDNFEWNANFDRFGHPHPELVLQGQGQGLA